MKLSLAIPLIALTSLSTFHAEAQNRGGSRGGVTNAESRARAAGTNAQSQELNDGSAVAAEPAQGNSRRSRSGFGAAAAPRDANMKEGQFMERVLDRGEMSLVNAPDTIKAMTNYLEQDSSKGIKGEIVALKVPTTVNFGIYAPGVIVRKGLYQDLNNSQHTTWISILIPQAAFDNAMVPGKQMHPREAITAQISAVIEQIVAEKPDFAINFIHKYSTGGAPYFHVMGNVNKTALEFLKQNTEQVMIAGSLMTAINIPLIAVDKLENRVALVKALQHNLQIVTNLE